MRALLRAQHEDGVGIDGYPLTGGSIVMRDSRLNHNDGGIVLSGGGSLRVTATEIGHNGRGIELVSWDGPALIRESRMSHNDIAVYGSQANDIHISDSILSDNADGVVLGMCFDATILDSTVRRNGTGISIVDTENDRATIAGNRIHDNRIGVQLGDGWTWSGPGTAIQGNMFRRNGAAGLLLDLDSSPANAIRIADNTFVRNGFTPGGTTDSLKQIVNDGAHIVGDRTALSAITLTGNRAHTSADYGIEANGVVDGGGNVGWGNGNPAQCLGVSCRDHVAIGLQRLLQPR